eukprot:TRINITY_DN7762_c0_g1_i1.p2 TRINITY_DN7762_c0_g1~~TRINITY_DN7762_c0_g1_i1.p2  ORF type:complete len:968 (+),score=73.38 TRINITY_DN7762_c0_g1_i1:3785-6688(+)
MSERNADVVAVQETHLTTSDDPQVPPGWSIAARSDRRAPKRPDEPIAGSPLPGTLPPTGLPSAAAAALSERPSAEPSLVPTGRPASALPTAVPSLSPDVRPSNAPTTALTVSPTSPPFLSPSTQPTSVTSEPTAQPSLAPFVAPSTAPTVSPGHSSRSPTQVSTAFPVVPPSAAPSLSPLDATHPPQAPPSAAPAEAPSLDPTASPSAPPRGTTAPPASASTPPMSASTPPTSASTPPTSASTPPVTPSGPPAPASTPPARASTPPSSASSPPASASGPPSTAPSSSPSATAPSSSPSATAPSSSLRRPTAPPTAAPAGPPPARAKPPIPDSVREAQESVKATASAATAVSLLSSSSPSGNVAKLAMLMDINCCDGGDGEAGDAMDWTMHPLAFKVAGSLWAGALAGNGIMLCTFILVHFTAVHILVGARGCGAGQERGDGLSDFQRVAAMVRFPSLAFLPFAFLFQGNMYAAAKLLVTADAAHPGRLVVAVAAILVLVTLLGIVIRMTNTSRSGFSARYIVDEPRTGRCVMLRDFLLGRAAWISTEGAFVERWGEIFDCWRPPYHRFLVIELGHMIPLTFLAVRNPRSWKACAVNTWLMTAVTTVYLLAVVIPRPYNTRFENLCMGVESALQVAALSCLAVGFQSENRDHGAFATAGTLMVVAMLVMLFKTVYDIVAFAMGLCEGRSERLRRRSHKTGLLNVLPGTEIPQRSGTPTEDDDPGGYGQLSGLFPCQDEGPYAGHCANLSDSRSGAGLCPPRSRTDCPSPAVGSIVVLRGLSVLAQYNGAHAKVLRTGEGAPGKRKVRVCVADAAGSRKVFVVNRANCIGAHLQDWVRQRPQRRSTTPHSSSGSSRPPSPTLGTSARSPGNPYFPNLSMSQSNRARPRTPRGISPGSPTFTRCRSPPALDASLVGASLHSSMSPASAGRTVRTPRARAAGRSRGPVPPRNRGSSSAHRLREQKTKPEYV